MKTTAVEWLTKKLRVEFGFAFSDNILEQAKEMEKQQIIDAWMAEDNELQRLAAEQYYNEKFKNK